MGKHEYTATVSWQRGDAAFTDNKYSRAHQWTFDGGTVVPVPQSSAAAVDPEEAFVAALSSCHMLFFLFHAAKKGFVVDGYEDTAVGTMGRNAEGRTAMLKIPLRPRATWSGEKRPTAQDLDAMHHQAHKDCFIANSVKCEVALEPRD